MHKVLLTVPEAADALGISRATIYRLLASGALASVTVGRCRRIHAKAIDAFVRRLEIEAYRPHTGANR